VTADAVLAAMPFAPGVVGMSIQASRKVGEGAVKQISNFSRDIHAKDLGLEGSVQELTGIFKLKDGVATMRVDMIKAEIANPMQIVKNMTETAKKNGATTLNIEGTIANERLYGILQKRYGMESQGARDVIKISLE